MSASHLQITPEVADDAVHGWQVVRVAEDLDLTTVAVFRTLMGRQVDGPAPPRLVLDLSALIFCDSNGLSALVNIHKQIQMAAGIGWAGRPPGCRSGQSSPRSWTRRIWRSSTAMSSARSSWSRSAARGQEAR